MCWHFPNYTNQGGRPAGAIREGDWKLVEHFEDGSVELYNLAQDVGEANDLAASEPARAEDLHRKLRHGAKALVRGCLGRIPISTPRFTGDSIRSGSLAACRRATAAATEPEWTEWRRAMNAAVKGPKAGGHACHGRYSPARPRRPRSCPTMRYEAQPNKDVLGFWTNPADWADWEFEVPATGVYEIEVQQGCGKGSCGAEVAVEVEGQALLFTVQDTGHFQSMIQRTIGQVNLTAGRHTLAIKPLTKPGRP